MVNDQGQERFWCWLDFVNQTSNERGRTRRRDFFLWKFWTGKNAKFLLLGTEMLPQFRPSQRLVDVQFCRNCQKIDFPWHGKTIEILSVMPQSNNLSMVLLWCNHPSMCNWHLLDMKLSVHGSKWTLLTGQNFDNWKGKCAHQQCNEWKTWRSPWDPRKGRTVQGGMDFPVNQLMASLVRWMCKALWVIRKRVVSKKSCHISFETMGMVKNSQRHMRRNKMRQRQNVTMT